MYNAMLRVLPAKYCVLSGSSTSQQKALLSTDPASVSGCGELARSSSPHLETTAKFQAAFNPNSSNIFFSKVEIQ